MHHTTQLCNFYIGPDDQPKKIKKKIKINHLNLYTILHNYATSTLLDIRHLGEKYRQ